MTHHHTAAHPYLVRSFLAASTLLLPAAIAAAHQPGAAVAGQARQQVAGKPAAPDPDADLPDADLSVAPRLAGQGPLEYGEAGDTHLSFGSGLGLTFEDEPSTDIGGFASYHRFLAHDVEFIAELAVFHYNQLGDNTIGVNPGVNFRWHYVNTGDWSLYADVGIGLLVSPDDVPDGGTSFNFTPRVGVGLTRRLTQSGLRLITGARWHHVSNARIEGDDRNPDRDGILLYAGLSFPI